MAIDATHQQEGKLERRATRCDRFSAVGCINALECENDIRQHQFLFRSVKLGTSYILRVKYACYKYVRVKNWRPVIQLIQYIIALLYFNANLHLSFPAHFQIASSSLLLMLAHGPLHQAEAL